MRVFATEFSFLLKFYWQPVTYLQKQNEQGVINADIRRVY